MAKRSSKLALLDKPQVEIDHPERFDQQDNPLVKEVLSRTNHQKSTPETLQNNTLTQLGVISLHEGGMSHALISSHTGIPKSTVNGILNNERLKNLSTGRVEHAKRALPVMLLELAFLSVSSITFEELKRLNPLQRGTLAAIAIDKARLLLGESTQNISIRELVPRLQAEMEDLTKKRDALIELALGKNGSYEAST